MCSSTVEKALPETSMWHGAISEEDVQLVRRRHAEKVKEWLDFADFVTELNALHEKYGIEKGEEGYFAYRKHLRTNYYQKLETYGPTPDPLDEGCDCIFCRMHAEDTPASEEPELREPRAKKPLAAELPTDAAIDRERETCSQKLEPVPAYEKNSECGPVLHVDHAIQEGHPATADYQQPSSIQKNQRRLGQVPAELPIDAAFNRNRETCSEKLRPVPAYDRTEPPTDPDPRNHRRRRKKKLGRVPACFERVDDTS